MKSIKKVKKVKPFIVKYLSLSIIMKNMSKYLNDKFPVKK